MNWSRKALLSQFYNQYKLQGMKREKVLELLGNPAVSSELYPGSEERHRIAIYCISAKNDASFRIDYDAEDKVTGAPFIEASPCEGSLYIGRAPAADKVLPIAALRKALLEKHSFEQIVKMKIGDIEALIGKQHESWTSNFRVGGRYWAATTHVWRLSADGHDVFVASGKVPLQSRDTVAKHVDSYSIVSMRPDCPFRNNRGKAWYNRRGCPAGAFC